MAVQSTLRRSRRKLTPRLVAVLALILGLGSATVRAAESSTGPSATPKHRTHHAGTATLKKARSHKARKARKSTRSRKGHRRYAPAPPSHGTRLGLHKTRDALALKSSAALVVDQDTGETLAFKNPDVVLPVASLTKLMTALVVTESGLSLDEVLQISSEDVDTQKNTHSRLKVGTRLSRNEMLLLALMSSENRAAMALSRHYPGGRAAFIARMNSKALALGMTSTHFADAAGLSTQSVSTARDLHRLLGAADAQPLIRRYSTQASGTVRVNGRTLTFNNSNRLVRKAGDWDIGLQKTGFTNEAGRCLAMQATVLGRRLAMIFLDSTGTMTRYADAARVRHRLEQAAKEAGRNMAAVAAAVATPAAALPATMAIPANP